jgi:hypothetical protein
MVMSGWTVSVSPGSEGSAVDVWACAEDAMRRNDTIARRRVNMKNLRGQREPYFVMSVNLDEKKNPPTLW